MKALTVWQPWASLIMIGAKPFEFRRWAAPARLIEERIVIHAGARKVTQDDLDGLDFMSLDEAAARYFLRSIWPDYEISGAAGRLPLAAGLGTAVLGRAIKCTELYPNDPEVDPAMWAWPLKDIEPFRRPVPAKGAQGFWDWPAFAEASAGRPHTGVAP